MPPTSTPKTARRPSTLAASKAIAAQLPLGARPPKASTAAAAAVARQAAAGMAGLPNGRPVRRGDDGASREWERYEASGTGRHRKDVRGKSHTGPATLAVKSATDTSGSHKWILGVVTFLGALLAVAGGMKATTSVAESRAATSIEGSLSKVSLHQSQYRVELQRFATWTELEERGVRLPSRQQVVRSSADASHWFLRVRDRNTGVECDRIGELVTDPTVEVKPTCRTDTGEGVGGV